MGLYPILAELAGLSIEELNEEIKDFDERTLPPIVLPHIVADLKWNDLGEQLFHLDVQTFDERVSANELMQELIEAFRSTLKQLDYAAVKRIVKQLVSVEDIASKESRNIARMRSEISVQMEILGFSGLSRGDQEELLLRLYSQKQEIELEVRALQARFRVAAEGYEARSNVVQTRVQEDPVVKELAHIVSLREQAKELLIERSKKQAEGPFEVLKSDTDLSLARAELAKQRAEASRRAGGEELLELQRQITMTGLELEEAGQRLSFIEEQIERLPKGGSVQIEAMQREVEVSEENHRKLLERSQEMRTTIDLHERPTVTVIPLDQMSLGQNLKSRTKKTDSNE